MCRPLLSNLINTQLIQILFHLFHFRCLSLFSSPLSLSLSLIFCLFFNHIISRAQRCSQRLNGPSPTNWTFNQITDLAQLVAVGRRGDSLRVCVCLCACLCEQMVKRESEKWRYREKGSARERMGGWKRDISLSRQPHQRCQKGSAIILPPHYESGPKRPIRATRPKCASGTQTMPSLSLRISSSRCCPERATTSLSLSVANAIPS